MSEVFGQFSDSFLRGADGVSLLAKPGSLRKNKDAVEHIWHTINMAFFHCQWQLSATERG